MKTGRFILFVAGMLFLVAVSCKKDPVNRPPVPSFTVTPDSGDTETPFVLDASGSSDPDPGDTVLEQRWDYEDDGIYDWLYVRTKVNIHKFPAPGHYTVRMQVKDAGGLTATTTRQVKVTQGNAWPTEPFAPNPRDSSNYILFGGRLSWVALDPYDDHLTYDLYLGTAADPPLIETNLPRDEYYPSGLKSGVNYYWRVVSRDPGGLTARSPMWRFSMHSGVYIRDTLTDPRDNQRYPIIQLCGSWWMTRNLNYNEPDYSLCYNNDPANCADHGRLYNNYVRDTLICPPGWRYPSVGDWSELDRSLGFKADPWGSQGWQGNDQAYQEMEGGTSGLNLQFSGYADQEMKFYFLNDKAFYNEGNSMRMMIRNYGQIYRDYRFSDNFKEVFFTAVRCIRSN